MTRVATRKRINVTLPHDTVHLMNRVVEKGDRSRFLDEAVRFFVREAGRVNLKRLLKEGALARAKRDLELARDWFPIEHGAWRRKGTS